MSTTVEDELSGLISSTVLILVGVVLSSAGTLIERLVVARVFSPEIYGEVSISLAIMSMGASVALVGFNHGVPRFVSRYGDERDVRGIWLTALVLSTVASLLIVGVLALNARSIAGLLFETPSSMALLGLFILAIPARVGLTIGLSAIRGMENTRYKMYLNDLFYPGFRIGLLLVLLVAGFGTQAVGYAYLVATVVAFVGAHVLFDRLCSLWGSFTLHARELVSFSAPLVATVLLSILLTRTDTLMLGYFRSSSEVGWYNAAYPLANSLLMVVTSFGYLYLPLTSRLDSEDSRGEINDIYQITTKWAFVVTFPAFLLFFFFPNEVLGVFFGAEYSRGGIALAILSIGFFTSAALGRNRETLSALGYTTGILVADVFAFGLNILLNLWLIPTAGIVGASIASAVAYVAQNAIISLILYAKFDISPVSAYTLRTYAVLPTTLVPLLVFASPLVPITAVTLPVVLVGIASLTVLVVLATGCLHDEDMILLTFVEERLGVDLAFVRRYAVG